MKLEELEAAALKLAPKGRGPVWPNDCSMETLSPEENARIWAEEAQRRAAALESGELSSRPAKRYFARHVAGSDGCALLSTNWPSAN